MVLLYTSSKIATCAAKIMITLIIQGKFTPMPEVSYIGYCTLFTGWIRL
jgi:hypothetical protein